MKKILLALSALAAMVPLYAAKPRTPEQIKVVSYNIRNGVAKDGPNSWEYRAPASAMMLLDQNPDVMGVQEAYNFQTGYLIQCCPEYRYVGVGRDNGKNAGEIMGVFYNKKRVSVQKWGTWWLSETPEKPSLGWDAACKRTATWALMKTRSGGHKFIFVNTHIDHKGREAQQKGVELLLAKIAELNVHGLPVVITGDFNMTPGKEPIRLVCEQYRNAREGAAVTDNEGTFHGWGKRSSMIDYIFFSGFSSCTEYSTVQKEYLGRHFISDHYPVSATLIF